MNKNRNPEVQRGDRVFDELDKNKVKDYSLTFLENCHFFYFKDGFLDSKELSAAMDASKAYLITKSKRVDKNRDGKLDRQWLIFWLIYKKTRVNVQVFLEPALPLFLTTLEQSNIIILRKFALDVQYTWILSNPRHETVVVFVVTNLKLKQPI